MKSLREQFEEEYKAVSIPANNKDGFKIKYVYYAPWYLWDLPEADLKRKKWLLAGISVGSFLLFLVAGAQDCGLNRFQAVELAGIFALCAHILESFYIIRFLFARYRTSRMTYSEIDLMLKSMPLIRGLCLIAAAIAGGYYLLMNGLQVPVVLVLGGYLVGALTALYIFREYRKIPLKTEKNEMLEQ